MFAVPIDQLPSVVQEIMIIVPEFDPERPKDKCTNCESSKGYLDSNGASYVECTKAEAPPHVQEQIDALNIMSAPTIVADGVVVAAGGVQLPILQQLAKARKAAAAVPVGV